MFVSEKLKKPPGMLLLMSGSIACAKASSLISEWSRRGHAVRVVCTRSVAEFVGPATLQGLGAEMVLDNVFAEGQAMEHINLARWADIIVAAPATSNLINKLASGIADDAVTTVWQAAYGRDKPMLLVPAMNTRMWRYPATRESVHRLQQWGIHVLPVGKGELACGEHGEGRMLEPADILQTVDRLLAFDRPGSGRRVLITGGGTRESIDSVRYIGNLSSGRTASKLADELAAAGHVVTWLGADDAVQPVLPELLESFYSFKDLEQQLRTLLRKRHYDVVIHAAAVSDFHVSSVEGEKGDLVAGQQGKLCSGTGLLLRLGPNPKLLRRLKSWSLNPAVRVVGFKLTHTEDQQQRIAAVRDQFENAGVDVVVHNDLFEIDPGRHPFSVFTPALEPISCDDGSALARTLNRVMETV